ncbi:MAG TPA: hypothetical protein VK776_23170 [Bryobacteraceae bacterium]|nr:hypothetical protein [Bryobacteraceae bacterium]
MKKLGSESSGVSRREFLKAFGVARTTGATGAIMSSRHLFGQQVNKSTAKGGRIDVYHHDASPAVEIGPGRAGRAPWTPELSLQQMDKFDNAVSILSMTQLGDILYDGTEKGRKAARTGNEYGAKLMADHPTGVPLPEDTWKADGIGIYTNDNHNRWPGDPYFDPIWQELNRQSTIVYMHPLAPQRCRDRNDGGTAAMNEFDFDITRACTSILAGGVIHKYSSINIIIPYSGGTMPVLAGRIHDRCPGDPKHAEYIPNGTYTELKKFYFDIAHASFSMPLAAFLKFAPEDDILVATDFSPEPIESTVNEFPTSGLPTKLMAAIERGNTEKLFPRFKV